MPRTCSDDDLVKTIVCTRVQQTPALLRPAPPWSGAAIVDAQFCDIASEDYQGKYLVLLFYPYDFTFVCPMELIQFSDRIDEFRSIGCEVVAVSTDSQYTHFAWITTPRKQGGLGEMHFAVLSDKSHKISKDYGILDEKTGTAFKALFIIDEKQILRQITINDTSVNRSVDEVLRLIQAYKFVDKYGDVCPAGPNQVERNFTLDDNNCTNYFSSV